MKIKLSKNQWEIMGEKAGWMKKAQKMMPNQTPYTEEEQEMLYKLIDNASKGDPTEKEEGELMRKEKDNLESSYRIKVIFDDGDYLYTTINGSKQAIKDYYLGRSFEKFDGQSHKAIRVLFI
jgi:hypothetical protein